MAQKMLKTPEKDEERITTALKKAEQGDLTDLDQVYEEYPSVWQALSDVSSTVGSNLVSWCGSKATGEALCRELSQMRKDFRYQNSGTLERLLIDRVLVCWLRVQQAEDIKTAKDKEGVNLQWAMVWERRLQIAHRNFLSACRTPAQVRRLLKPRVAQLNIGQQQLNVAQLKAEN